MLAFSLGQAVRSLLVVPARSHLKVGAGRLLRAGQTRGGQLGVPLGVWEHPLSCRQPGAYQKGVRLRSEGLSTALLLAALAHAGLSLGDSLFFWCMCMQDL